MTLRRNPWSVLGIEVTDDQKAIKRAYAARLKARRPEDDAEAFQELRAAYDWALLQAGAGQAVAVAVAMPPTAEILPFEKALEAGLAGVDLDQPVPPAPAASPPAPVSAKAPPFEEPAHAAPEVTELKEAVPPAPPAAPPAFKQAPEFSGARSTDQALEELDEAVPPMPVASPAAPVPPATEILPLGEPMDGGPAVAELDEPAPPAPAAPPPKPVIDLASRAAALWASFVRHAAVQPNTKLANLLDSDAMQNLELREQLEIQAANYCASDACDEALRHSVVIKFGWPDDCSHLLRIGRREVLVALARHHSDRAFREMQRLAGSNLAVKALLENRPPRFTIQTMDSGFMKEMRKHLDMIQSQCPALLDYRLNGEVVAYWVKQAERKKYFLQTAVLSFAAGCMLWLLLGLGAVLAGIDTENMISPAFLVSQVLVVGGTAIVVLRPPKALLRAGENFRHRIWFPYLDKCRRSSWLQFGWMPVLALLALATLVPEFVERGKVPLTVALAVCAFFAWQSISFDVQRKLGALTGLSMFAGILAVSMFIGSFAILGFIACFAIAFCVFLQGIRGPAQWSTMLNVCEASLRNMRVAWLAAAAGLYALCLWPAMPGLLASGLLILCALTGLALTQIVFEKPELLGVLVLAIASGWASETYHPIQEPHFRFLVISLSIVFGFMCGSVARSAYAGRIKN